ncbi:MAG: molybdopterin-dependent oxidoreductase [Chloroflexi bacterium]|nr:molybdopterin-dependent oxidoreductase [Chloroflexota bacterium]
MNTKQPENCQISRRDFLKISGAVGAGAAFLGALPKAQRALAQNASPTSYPFSKPENIIYSACLQCNTQCALKAKIQDGILVKADGNPYSPNTMLPPISYDTPLTDAVFLDGKFCPKGQANIQMQYDPYRIVKVLKRAGARGSNKWQVIPFEQAINEIVNGGKLFADLGEDRVVPGFKDVAVTTDAKVISAIAADAAAVAGGKLKLDEFKSKHSDHLDLLIDPDHPDLGVKNNQFVFLAGRIEPGRNDFAKRFTLNSLGSVNWYDHTAICELSHHIAYTYTTAQYSGGKWATGPNHMKPDTLNAEFVIFWGTSPFEANFGPTIMTEAVTKSMVERNFKFAVVDPRLSKTAAKGWWIPMLPGGDLPLALGMLRWMLDNQRYDAKFLANANKGAAVAAGEKSWTNSTWLVKVDDKGHAGALLRGTDLKLVEKVDTTDAATNKTTSSWNTPDGQSFTLDPFIALVGGAPTLVDPTNDKTSVIGDLFVDTALDTFKVKSGLQILLDEVSAQTVEEWAQTAGVDVQTLTALAQEFTSHGKKAAIEFYRGAVQHTNGYYTAQAIIALNLLVGNMDWKGGLSAGGGAWNGIGNKDKPFDLSADHPGKIGAYGIKLTREGSTYEKTTLFQAYPAPRPFYPYTSNIYQEVIPAAYAEYPYPIKILWLHKGTPALATPAGTEQIKMLMDTDKFPLFIADDIVIAETSMYADYLFPDVTSVERWAFIGSPPPEPTKTIRVRQPVVAPLTEIVTVDGAEMPISMEAIMLAVGKALALPGIGKGGFDKHGDFNRPEDYYLRAVANIAFGDAKDGADAAPEADDAELELFRQARRHLPAVVFDEARWQAAVGDEIWRKTVYVLNRGGRFEDSSKAYSGNFVGHPYARQLNLYIEPVATGKDSITGQSFVGVAHYEPIRNSTGTPVDDKDYPVYLITYKEVVGTQTRTISNYWTQGGMGVLPVNSVLMNPKDGEALGLGEGELVKFASRTNPNGTYDLGNGQVETVQGKVKFTQGVRPGVALVSFHFGHWAYGARDVIVDGTLIKGDPRRAGGLCSNPLMLLDEGTKTTCLTDPIGGSASFYDTKVKVEKV